MNRRDFLSRSGSGGFTALSAASAQRVWGANSRVRIALVGCGGRGKNVARAAAEVPNVEYAAFCDVYDPQAEQAKQEFGGAAKTYRDFRRVLDRGDVDAIHIATPDHWHAIPAVLACDAGKHVFCEKPLAHNIHEGKAIVAAAAKSKAVFLTGTQHRSAPHLAECAELIRGGKIGGVHFVRVWNYANFAPDGLSPLPDEPVPEGLDWDFYLGPAPWVPFNRRRFLRTYRWFFDYAGGWITDFGVHRLDTVHQIMGDDKPRTIAASGNRYALGGVGGQPDTLQVTVEYPHFVLSYESTLLNSFGALGRTTPERTYYGARGEENRPNGMAFYGSNATLLADRRGYEVIPEGEGRASAYQPAGGSGRSETIGRMYKNGPEATALHARHFIRCIRDGEKPRCDALVGHRGTNIALLGNIACKTGRKLQWDAKKDDFVDDPEASRLLGRVARKPWDLITL